MPSRDFATAAFFGLVVAGLVTVWQFGRPTQLVSESDNRDLLSGIATGQAVGLTAIAPTQTAYASSTPTRTPKPPTATPRPTYGAEGTRDAGIYVVPAYTETAVIPLTVEPDTLPPCVTVTPKAYADQLCRWPG